jgi:hypothetical protein
MAIAFGRSAAFSGAGASPLSAALTLNAGETGVCGCTLDPTTLAVTGVTDNAAGGSSSFASRGALNQSTSVRGELWSTGPSAGKASTSTSMAFSGSNTDSGLIASAYTGVLAVGNIWTDSGSGANPSVTHPIQDAGGFLVTHFACLSAFSLTAGTGNLRQTDADSAITQALVDNTAGAPGNVTCSVTLGAGPWVAITIELRPVAGGIIAPLLGNLFVGPIGFGR